MVDWRRSRRADIVLRVSGLLCWVSYTAISRLVAMHVPPPRAGALAYGIAALGFMAASAGSALTLLGHHLFDKIELSPRWRARSDLNVFLPSEGAKHWTSRNRPC
jgi:MFS family permease